MEHANYQEFRKLLKAAIGDTPQNQFAKQADLSPAHLNRLLNNEVISQPSIETLKKILRVNPVINGFEMFRSCEYPATSDIWDGIPINKIVDLVSDALKKGFLKLKKEQKLWKSFDDFLKVYYKKYGWLFKKINFCKTAPNQDETHDGTFAFCCEAVWTKKINNEEYFYCETQFVIYGYLLKDETNEFLFDDVAVDGLSLYRAGHTRDVEDALYSTGDDIRKLPNLTFMEIRKIEYDDKTRRLLDAISNKNESSTEFTHFFYGIGVPYYGAPKNIEKYLLENDSWAETPKTVEIYNELYDRMEENPEIDSKELEELFYPYINVYGRGVIAALMTVLEHKQKESGLEFEIGFYHSEYSCLSDCIYVKEDFWLVYNRVDKKRQSEIEDCFSELLEPLGFKKPSSVIIVKVMPVELEEESNYLPEYLQ